MEYAVTVSYIEIYLEELRDLLDVETSGRDIHVREDDKGNTGNHIWLRLIMLTNAHLAR